MKTCVRFTDDGRVNVYGSVLGETLTLEGFEEWLYSMLQEVKNRK